MASLGQDLKRERELRGISLKEISSSTKISLRFLEALEEDRLDIIPGNFFIKAILKSYAKFIGLDEDYVLNKFYEASLEQEQSQESKQIKRRTRPRIKKNVKKLIYFAALIILLGISLFILYYLFFLEKQAPPAAEKPKASTRLQEENVLPPSRTEPLAEFLAKKEGLTIEISFEADTWLQVWADGVLKVDGIKQPGDIIMIKANEELLIHTGNAGGISYTLNNKPGKKFGPRGSVISNIRITSKNYERYIAQEEDATLNL